MKDHWIKGKRLHRPFILVSVMLAMFLSAIEATIVATAMPTIVADLGGFSLYSWVFSIYLLTSAATILIFGKLADIYGRKPIFVSGILLFLLGSTLSGFSITMYQLIGSRFIQGIGAGALMPMATTIVGDIYNKQERAKIQGYLSAVWGISAVSGPLLGGLFVDLLDWRYVFWMNIPLGLLAMLGIIIFLREDMIKKPQTIDYKGSILLIVMISLLVFILVEGGVSIAWDSIHMIILLSITAIACGLFYLQQKSVADPMMPFEIWRHEVIRIANITSLLTGMILIGVSSYLPAFVQGVMGKSAMVAGFTLTTMSIGWPIASVVAGRLLLVKGYRITSLFGGFSLVIGSLIFFMLSPERGPIWAGTGSFFIGIGMGMTSTAFIVAIQSSTPWDIRGIATAANMFMRSLGSVLGVALFGGLLNSEINKYIGTAGLDGQINVDSTDKLLAGEQSATLSGQEKVVLEEGLTSGLHHIYVVLALLAIMSLILIYFMPRDHNKGSVREE
ncbi:MAG TPA: MDR family MFS transporter [Virgibacillus sp.]|nr:MDR family MFS transporter [Virgibacillus sp.]